MTFYHQQVIAIKANFLPRDYLCCQVIRAKEFIEQNCCNTVTLDDIAAKAYCSKFHFLRLFKAVYGRTPHQYLTEVRIKKAKQLLKSGLPVADTCYLTGFGSISSFKALFKKCTGRTPSFYLKQVKQQEISQTCYRFLPYTFTKSNFQDC